MKTHCALVPALALWLATPGLRADTILVPGDPPLTREAVNRTRDMMEWVLDLRLSDDQHDKWQSAFVTEWQKKDHADMVSALAGWEEFKRWMERVKKLGPAE